MLKLRTFTSKSDFKTLLRSSFNPLTPVFVGSWRGQFATKWRGLSAELSYNTYLRNGWIVLNTGVKGETGMPIIEFSSWEPYLSDYSIAFPTVLSYKFFFKKAFWRVGFLARTSRAAAEEWVSTLPGYFALLNNTNRRWNLRKNAIISSARLQPVTFLLLRFAGLGLVNSQPTLLAAFLSFEFSRSFTFKRKISKSLDLYDATRVAARAGSSNRIAEFFFENYLCHSLCRSFSGIQPSLSLLVKSPRVWKNEVKSFALYDSLLKFNTVLSLFFSARLTLSGRALFARALRSLVFELTSLVIHYKSIVEGFKVQIFSIESVAKLLLQKYNFILFFSKLSFHSFFKIFLNFFFISITQICESVFGFTSHMQSSRRTAVTRQLNLKLFSYKLKHLWAVQDSNASVETITRNTRLKFEDFLKNFVSRPFPWKGKGQEDLQKGMRKALDAHRKRSEAKPPREKRFISLWRPYKVRYWRRRSAPGVRVYPRFSRFRPKPMTRLKLPFLKKQFLFLYFWSINFFSFFTAAKFKKNLFWISTRLKFFFRLFLKFLKFYSFTVDYFRLSSLDSIKNHNFFLLKFKSFAAYFWGLLKKSRVLLVAFLSLTAKLFRRYYGVFIRGGKGVPFFQLASRVFVFSKLASSNSSLKLSPLIETTFIRSSLPLSKVTALSKLFVGTFKSFLLSSLNLGATPVQKLRRYLKFLLVCRRTLHTRFRCDVANLLLTSDFSEKKENAMVFRQRPVDNVIGSHSLRADILRLPFFSKQLIKSFRHVSRSAGRFGPNFSKRRGSYQNARFFRRVLSHLRRSLSLHLLTNKGYGVFQIVRAIKFLFNLLSRRVRVAFLSTTHRVGSTTLHPVFGRFLSKSPKSLVYSRYRGLLLRRRLSLNYSRLARLNPLTRIDINLSSKLKLFRSLSRPFNNAVLSRDEYLSQTLPFSNVEVLVIDSSLEVLRILLVKRSCFSNSALFFLKRLFTFMGSVRTLALFDEYKLFAPYIQTFRAYNALRLLPLDSRPKSLDYLKEGAAHVNWELTTSHVSPAFSLKFALPVISLNSLLFLLKRNSREFTGSLLCLTLFLDGVKILSSVAALVYRLFLSKLDRLLIWNFTSYLRAALLSFLRRNALAKQTVTSKISNGLTGFVNSTWSQFVPVLWSLTRANYLLKRRYSAILNVTSGSQSSSNSVSLFEEPYSLGFNQFNSDNFKLETPAVKYTAILNGELTPLRGKKTNSHLDMSKRPRSHWSINLRKRRVRMSLYRSCVASRILEKKVQYRRRRLSVSAKILIAYRTYFGSLGSRLDIVKEVAIPSSYVLPSFIDVPDYFKSTFDFYKPLGHRSYNEKPVLPGDSKSLRYRTLLSSRGFDSLLRNDRKKNNRAQVRVLPSNAMFRAFRFPLGKEFFRDTQRFIALWHKEYRYCGRWNSKPYYKNIRFLARFRKLARAHERKRLRFYARIRSRQGRRYAWRVRAMAARGLRSRFYRRSRMRVKLSRRRRRKIPALPRFKTPFRLYRWRLSLKRGLRRYRKLNYYYNSKMFAPRTFRYRYLPKIRKVLKISSNRIVKPTRVSVLSLKLKHKGLRFTSKLSRPALKKRRYAFHSSSLRWRWFAFCCMWRRLLLAMVNYHGSQNTDFSLRDYWLKNNYEMQHYEYDAAKAKLERSRLAVHPETELFMASLERKLRSRANFPDTAWADHRMGEDAWLFDLIFPNGETEPLFDFESEEPFPFDATEVPEWKNIQALGLYLLTSEDPEELIKLVAVTAYKRFGSSQLGFLNDLTSEYGSVALRGPKHHAPLRHLPFRYFGRFRNTGQAGQTLLSYPSYKKPAYSSLAFGLASQIGVTATVRSVARVSSMLKLRERVSFPVTAKSGSHILELTKLSLASYTRLFLSRLSAVQLKSKYQLSAIDDRRLERYRKVAYRAARTVRKLRFRAYVRKLGLFPKNNKRARRDYWKLVNTGRIARSNVKDTSALYSIFDRRNKLAMNLKTEYSKNKKRFRFIYVKLFFPIKRRLWATLVLLINKVFSVFWTKFRRKARFINKRFRRMFRGGKWNARKKYLKDLAATMLRAAYFFCRFRGLNLPLGHKKMIRTLLRVRSIWVKRQSLKNHSTVMHNSVFLTKVLYARFLTNFLLRARGFRETLKQQFFREGKFTFIFSFLRIFLKKIAIMLLRFNLFTKVSSSNDLQLSSVLLLGGAIRTFNLANLTTNNLQHTNVSLFRKLSFASDEPISDVSSTLIASALKLFAVKSQVYTTTLLELSIFRGMFDASNSFLAWRRASTKFKLGTISWKFILTRPIKHLTLRRRKLAVHRFSVARFKQTKAYRTKGARKRKFFRVRARAKLAPTRSLVRSLKRFNLKTCMSVRNYMYLLKSVKRRVRLGVRKAKTIVDKTVADKTVKKKHSPAQYAIWTQEAIQRFKRRASRTYYPRSLSSVKTLKRRKVLRRAAVLSK